MKKSSKITAVILGIMLILVLAVLIFLPGLPTYIKVKKDYKYCDRTIGTFEGFDVESPKDFVPFTKDGITVMGPENARNDGSLVPFKSDGLIVSVSVLDDEDDGAAYFDEQSLYTRSDYRHFFRKLDIDTPQNSYENVVMLRNLTAKDCLGLRGTDKKVFLEYMQYKEFSEEVERINYYEKDGIKGFFCELSTEGSKKIKYSYSLWLFHNEKQYIVHAYSDDKETAMQILATVEIK